MRYFINSVISGILLLALFSCGSDKNVKEEKKVKEEPKIVKKETKQPQPITVPENAVTTKSGLKYVDIVEGTGKSPETGQKVSVQYTGYLMNGKKFDSSYDHNKPLEFAVGVSQMIPGFDEGVLSMKTGGKRKLFIPSDLAYGSNGIPGVIPPNAMIVFEVELLDIK